MIGQNNQAIAPRIKVLLEKQNAYVKDVLDDFIRIRLEEINRACETIQLEPDKIIKVHTAFIEQLEKIQYSLAYTNKLFKRENNTFDIDFDSFNKFMLKQIPSLADPEDPSRANPEGFISESLGIKEKKKQILAQVMNIKKTINLYSGDNKKPIIEIFNQEINRLITSLDEKSYFEAVASSKLKLTEILRNIQLSEDNYYTGLTLFVQYRKSNSSLQPKINEAIRMIDSIQIFDEPSHAVARERRFGV